MRGNTSGIADRRLFFLSVRHMILLTHSPNPPPNSITNGDSTTTMQIDSPLLSIVTPQAQTMRENETLLRGIIDDAILTKTILSVKYWGGSKGANCGTVRQVQPYGWKEINSKCLTATFYGNCEHSNVIKNYCLCLIENIYCDDVCLISIDNVNFRISNHPTAVTQPLQNRPFELPQFNEPDSLSTDSSLRPNAIDMLTRKQITVVATHYKTSSNQAASLVAYCKGKDKISSLNSTIRFILEAYIVYQYAIALLCSQSSGLYLQFDGSGLDKGRGFIVIRFGGANDGEKWNHIVRYTEVYSGGAFQVTKKLLDTISEVNELQKEMRKLVTKVYYFRGMKLDNCNENTGEWNGVKTRMRTERQKQHLQDNPGFDLTPLIVKVNN